MANLNSLAEEWELPADSFAYRWVQELKAEGRIEGKAEGKIEGKIEGKAEGIEEGVMLTIQIIQLLETGKTPAQIVEELEVSLELVQKVALQWKKA